MDLSIWLHQFREDYGVCEFPMFGNGIFRTEIIGLLLTDYANGMPEVIEELLQLVCAQDDKYSVVVHSTNQKVTVTILPTALAQEQLPKFIKENCNHKGVKRIEHAPQESQFAIFYSDGAHPSEEKDFERLLNQILGVPVTI